MAGRINVETSDGARFNVLARYIGVPESIFSGNGLSDLPEEERRRIVSTVVYFSEQLLRREIQGHC